MTNKFTAIILTSFLIFLGCTKKQALIQNPERSADIQRMLLIQKEMTNKSLIPIWDIFNQKLSSDEKQAMEFIYAYMPLSDLADYSPDFFLKNVQLSLLARQEMPWGNIIPEEEFLHFVLPLRVNNENLDNFREEMYSEIKERIKGLGMKQAVLEINHWCHEKVTYRGTDSRTSAPLSTVKKTFGRCGEESTFVVTSLRTAGIPARQVYTPRWAHTDDNHAWVEVWIEGKWSHIESCGPDCDVNMAWFVEPATRIMLLHSRTYGRYFGKENVIDEEDRFSELNLTSNYAIVKSVTVSVKNSDGTPADSAKVEYQLYNYAEYYPIATGITNDMGFSTMITGMGDLIIWAAKDGKYSYQKFSVPEKDTIELVLDQTSPTSKEELFDFIAPHGLDVEQNVTKEARRENDRRLAQEDSIRNAYMSTFKDSVWIVDFAQKNKLPADSIFPFIKLSYGNWDQISGYLEKNATQYRGTVLEFLSQLADKDFSDTPEATLTDHLVQTAQSGIQKLIPSKDLFARYVLSPRIALENLSPWRSFLATSFGSEMAQSTCNDISILTQWINENIRVNLVANKHSRAPLSPIGVYNLRVADPISRDIFFVAVCRTFGIPARLKPETRFPEYNKDGEWLRVGFDKESLIQPDKGSVLLVDKNNPLVPQYHTHFTLSILREGFFRTLEFKEGEKLTDLDTPIELDIGQYALITGNRFEDGSVLSKMTFFTIEKGKMTTVPVELRQQSVERKPTGKLNLEQLSIEKTDGNISTLSSLIDGANSVIVILDPVKEPSKHILNDLSLYVNDFNQWGGQFVFALPPERADQFIVFKTYKLPVKVDIGIDKDRNILKAITNIYSDEFDDKLPLVLYCNHAGDVYMFSSGYKIGIGEQLLKVINAIEPVNKTAEAIKACSR